MRRHRSFRAAWVFGYAGGQREPGHGPAYHLVLLMHPRDGVAFRDLRISAFRRWGAVVLCTHEQS
jgi:hypothetical protein